MKQHDLHTAMHAENHMCGPTCVAAMRISPFLGVHRLLTLPINVIASARASSVCTQKFGDNTGQHAQAGQQQQQ
jgi:hypothetical protein